MATLAIKLAPLPPPIDRSSPRKMPQISPTAQVVKISSTLLNLSKKAALTKHIERAMTATNASTIINFNQTTADSTKWLELERASSGIPTSLWKPNVTIDGGWELLNILVPDLWQHQRQQTYINAPTRRIADRYANVTDSGAWLATGWQPAGIEPVPVVKPQNPRWDNQNQKFIKYETPKGAPALPFFAWVPYSFGLKIAERQGRKELKAYQERIGVRDLEAIDRDFWPWVVERNWRLTVTEGVKKSLALIAQGILTVGLRGITQWRAPKTNGLSNSLRPFATKGRKWQIALDQDTKLSTRVAVRGQVLKLGRAIEKKAGTGKVSILEWLPEQGKGIDDLLVAAGESSDKALAEIIRNARTLAAYKRDLETSLRAIADLQKFTSETLTIGEKLTTLPELPADHLLVIDSSMGTGKTYRIVNDLIKVAKSAERLTVLLAPNNNLCSQVAKAADLPHIHDYGTRSTDVEALKADIYHRSGVVMCLDSLPRLLAICPGILNSSPLVIIDEVSQVLANLATAGTLGRRQSEGGEAFDALVQSAYAVGIAECGIPQRCIDIIQSAAKGNKASKFLSSINKIDRQELKVVRVHHRNPNQAWPVTMYRSPRDSAFLADLIAAIEQGGTHYFATTSKAKAKQLTLILTTAFPDKKIVRIDSETTEGGAYNELFRRPDEWLREEKLDVLIATTTMQSGISIDGDKSVEESYFSDVWGHFPSLTPDLHMQQLARVRAAVARHIWIPETIQRTPEECTAKPWGLMHFWQQHANAQANFHDLEQPAALEDFDLALQKFCAETMAVAGLQKSIAFEYLKRRLEEDGHLVKVVECGSDKTVAQELMKAREQLELAEAEAIAAVLIDPEVDTIAWAAEELSSTSSTVKSRRKANKVMARQRFPEVLFDDVDTALSLVTGYGALAKAAELRAGAENPIAERAMEKTAVVELLNASTGGYHLLPKRGNQAQILADTGILDLINCGEEYSRDSQIVKRIAAQAIKYSDAIWQFFSLNISEGQDLVGICHRLLKRLDYVVDQNDKPGAILKTSRTGNVGNQVQHYRIVEHPSEVYRQLLMAARARRGLLAAVSKGELDSSTDDCKKDGNPATQAFEREATRMIPFDSGADREEGEDFEEDYFAEGEESGFN
jgi:Domain of unknown function (DUF3854)